MSATELPAVAATVLPPRPAPAIAPPPSWRAWSRRLAYGALGLPLAMAALPIYVHAPRLWAEATGLSLAVLGGVLLAARLCDAVIDPLLGAWSDRAGRRQGLILLALPFLAAGFFALLHPPPQFAVLWLLLSLLTTYFGFSLASIAYQAWGAEIGRDAGERTRLVACREGFGLVGVVLAAVLPTLLGTSPANGNPLADGAPTGLAAGLATLAWIYPPLLAALGAVTLLASPTHVAHTNHALHSLPRRPPFWQGLRQPLADARFRRLLGVFVVNGVAAALPATLVLFFVADVLQAARWSGAFLALYFIAGVVFLPLWVALSRRIGRVAAWVSAMLLACLSFVWASLLGPGDVLSFGVICLLSGAALGADLTLPAALLADISAGRVPVAGYADDTANADDGDNAAQRCASESSAGGYFGWWNLVSKLNLALAAGLSLPLLDVVGYRPEVHEAGAVAALVAVYCGLPIVFKTVAATLAWRWRRQLEGFS
ncbi:MFS transporter [Rhodocyclus gracilis]|uniref:MFS transporter n=1 Tax=Rhodocyclus tenuis TaxID=1066 RepID=A0A6L5JZI9_RHOTE|nr:MFS transporter [Rhodocyclus gracilis]MQY52723.1 MFS transporter [Rhodocyclus gracilis]